MSLIDHDIKIDFLVYKEFLTIIPKDGKIYVKDPIRKKNIILQPEELVRQLCIAFFIRDTDFNRNNIQVEKLISINQLSRRFDIVIYDAQVKPFILVECKAPDITINQSTFDQIAVYNMKLDAPYLLVTNGKHTYCAQMDHHTKSYRFLDQIPGKNTL